MNINFEQLKKVDLKVKEYSNASLLIVTKNRPQNLILSLIKEGFNLFGGLSARFNTQDDFLKSLDYFDKLSASDFNNRRGVQLRNFVTTSYSQMGAVIEGTEASNNDDDYAYKIVNEPSAYEIYYSKVKEFEEEWNDDDNHLKKIFKDNIDPSVLAFLDLDEDDKLLLTN